MYWGIDPSITNTGLVGLNERGEAVVYKRCGFCIGKQKNNSILGFVKQAEVIADTIMQYDGPHYVAYENYAYGAKEKDRHIIEIAEFGGVLKAKLLSIGIDAVRYVSPTELKKFMHGEGYADKDDMKQRAVEQFPVIAKEVSKKNGHDVADAAALAFLCLYQCDPELGTYINENEALGRSRVQVSTACPPRTFLK